MFDMHNQVSATELETLFRSQLKHLWQTPDLSKTLPPLMIWGAPGVGKSTIIQDLANDLDVGFIDVRLAQREPVDIRGLPVPKEHGVEWLVAAEWPRDPQSRGIILFDELTAADRSLQVAAYEFILDRRLGTLYKVPDGWYICAAGNRAEDRAVAMTMSSALANRFLHVELAVDATCWCKWALGHDVHPAVIGFIRYRPELLFSQKEENLERGWPSPRSWERISTMLKILSDETGSLLRRVVYGLIGNGAGVEFHAFYQTFLNFADVRELMLNSKAGIVIPEKADQRYAFCAAMVYYLWRGTDEKEMATLLDGFYRISLKLPSDFATLAMVDAIHGTRTGDECAEKLHAHPLYPEWTKIHGTALRRTMQRVQGN